MKTHPTPHSPASYTGPNAPARRPFRSGAIAAALAACALLPATTGWSAPNDAALRDEAVAGLKRAATFFRSNAASRFHGGYVYYVSADLKERWGEGVATADQAFVEPPGTPAVGCVYLEAFDATGDSFYLDAAKDAARALVYGQLQSGGWTQRIDFDPKGSHASKYRNGRGKADGFNHSSLDDNQTQSAIQFLARLDRTLQFKDAAIHEAVQYALDNLLKAQFPNGAFPQGWKEPVTPHPVLKASYANDWLRVWPHEDYYKYYTLNDGLTGTVSDALLTAFEVYQDERYRGALARLGDFLILAQMPDPQPAWAQQYGYDMHPTWARKFEPPAICGFESEDAIKTLMKVYCVTGDRKYLEPIPRALAYLRTGVLPDGQMARYYELRTNRPLYMNRKPGVSGNSNAPGYYDLTYDDRNLPAHYGWKQHPRLDELQREFAALQKGPVPSVKMTQRVTPAGKLVTVDPTVTSVTPSVTALATEVRKILAELDDQGRWITTYAGDRNGHDLVGQPAFKKGFRFIASNVFNYNAEVISTYIAATRAK